MDLSVRLGRSTDLDTERVRALIGRSGLARDALDVDEETMLNAMGMDKKVMDGHLRLIVCNGIGRRLGHQRRARAVASASHRARSLGWRNTACGTR